MQRNAFKLKYITGISAVYILLLHIPTGCKTSLAARQSKAAMAEAVKVANDTTKPIQKINLPVFIPIAELQQRLYDLYFKPGYGKFYPCSGQNDCGDLYKDLYVENPILAVQDEFISINLHLAGTVHAFIFSPSVSGDITLTAKPVVSNDTLYFQDMKMENSSKSFLLGIASALFEKQIVSRIQSKACFSFRPALDKYTAEFQKHTPLKWGATALLLSLKKIYLQKVRVVPAPSEGVLVDFSAELCTEKPTFGQ